MVDDVQSNVSEAERAVAETETSSRRGPRAAEPRLARRRRHSTTNNLASAGPARPGVASCRRGGRSVAKCSWESVSSHLLVERIDIASSTTAHSRVQAVARFMFGVGPRRGVIARFRVRRATGREQEHSGERILIKRGAMSKRGDLPYGCQRASTAGKARVKKRAAGSRSANTADASANGGGRAGGRPAPWSW
jgi:hypothetical protein